MLLHFFHIVVLATTILAALSPYEPIRAICPSTSLVRPAIGLSAEEASYRYARKNIADVALKAWLKNTNSGFSLTNNTPTVALTTGGGGYRSLLLGAGVIQGLDARDSNARTSGLYQALTYQAGLSGGAWLLSSLAGNNYPTVTSLKRGIWEQAFQDSLLLPDFLLASQAYAQVTADILEKEAAGFPPTLTDPWGRLLSYQLLYGPDGGVSDTLSSFTSESSFTNHLAPFPIITALGVKTFNGECLPGPNATTYEFTPYEFGSWDSDLSAFTQTAYLDSSLANGQPIIPGVCVKNYDNLGYILGTSSNLFNEACSTAPNPINSTTNLTSLAAIVNQAHALSTRDEYAIYPNSFYLYTSPTSNPNPANPIPAQKILYLVDGSEALQNNLIWPFLQPSRFIDVLIVNDNSADTSTNFPNGSEILTTYVQSLSHNLTLMPFIPPVSTFISEGLNKRATFFGCNDPAKITIVYIPNVNYTYPSNQPTARVQYSMPETDAMIANGVQMATQGGEEGWGTCLGCAILMKTWGNCRGSVTGVLSGIAIMGVEFARDFFFIRENNYWTRCVERRGEEGRLRRGRTRGKWQCERKCSKKRNGIWFI